MEARRVGKRLGVKRGKGEGGDKRSAKPLVPYPVRALRSLVRVRRRPGTKGSWERPPAGELVPEHPEVGMSVVE